MDLENKDIKKLEMLGVTKWLEAGITGKGIRFLELEMDTSHCIDVLKPFKELTDIETFIMPNGLTYSPNQWLNYIDSIKPNVVGMSMSMQSDEFYTELANGLHKKGIPFIVSSGNEGKDNDTRNRIAKYDKVIGIGACMELQGEFKRISYSNYGETLDFVTPTFYGLIGTSFSQPIFSLMCCLLMQKYGQLNHEQIYDYFKNHTIDLQEAGFDKYTGYGLPCLGDINEDWKFDKMLDIKYRPCLTQRITSLFGETEGRSAPHNGIDISPVTKVHENIITVADGIVTSSIISSSGGNMITVKHIDCITRYLHLNERKVQSNTNVKAGQIIGTMGTTGDSTGEHLHFDINVNGKFIDPLEYMNLEYKERGVDLTREETLALIEETLQAKESSPSEWAVKEFNEAIKLGITDGTRPGGYATREQVAIMVKRGMEEV